MNEIDRKIGAALDADDRAFLKSLEEERGLFGQMGDTMMGPLGGWARFAAVIAFAMAAIFFFAIWQLLTATDQRSITLWATLVIFTAMAQGMLKQWFFERMNLLSVLRELKRIEIRIAAIEERR